MVRTKFAVVVGRNVKKVRLNLRGGTCVNFEYANATKSRERNLRIFQISEKRYKNEYSLN